MDAPFASSRWYRKPVIAMSSNELKLSERRLHCWMAPAGRRTIRVVNESSMDVPQNRKMHVRTSLQLRVVPPVFEAHKPRKQYEGKRDGVGIKYCMPVRRGELTVAIPSVPFQTVADRSFLYLFVLLLHRVYNAFRLDDDVRDRREWISKRRPQERTRRPTTGGHAEQRGSR